MTVANEAFMQCRVGALRDIVKSHAIVACVFLILTLSMKLAVPVGFMPQLSDHGVELVVCDGMASTAVAVHTMPGHHHHHDAPTKTDAPCPFAGLTAPAIGGADQIQLAAALVDMLIAGVMVAATLRLIARGHLRPPLRGPPPIA